jgi:hypothetical protein
MCKDAIVAWFEIFLYCLGELWESTNILLRILGPREELKSRVSENELAVLSIRL